jgi:hypothetical protein
MEYATCTTGAIELLFPTVGTHRSATKTSVCISTKMVYLMLCENRLWNVSVLQRVHLPNLPHLAVIHP